MRRIIATRSGSLGTYRMMSLLVFCQIHAGIDDPQQLSIGSEFLLAAVGQPPQRPQHLSVGGQMLFVIPVRGDAPRGALPFANVADLATDRVAGQLDRVLTGLPGLHSPESIPRRPPRECRRP